jgi:hypothetical protein
VPTDSATGATASGPAATPGTGLVGRGEELARLREAVLAADGGALVLRGDPGIGKSALLAAVSEVVIEAGGHLRTLSGVESEAQLPFAGLHQLLAPLLDHAADLPVLQSEALEIAFGLRDGPRPDPYQIAIASAALLTSAAAERRVVVLADDVQWLDVQSLEVLTFVARRLAGTSVVVVAAVRTGHTSPFLEAGVPVLEIRALDEASAHRLVAERNPDLTPTELRRLEAEASGNPLALLELPRHPVGLSDGLEDRAVDLPARLERAFAGRFDELPEESRDVVLVAAVDPADDVDEVEAATAALRGARVERGALAAAEAANLLHVRDGRITFRHPLVRSGVLRAEPIARRQAANAALAAVLIDDPYRATWHRAQAIVGPDDAVADELEANVAAALARGAVTVAIRDLERSAQLTSSQDQRGRRLLVAAQHAFSIGRRDEVDRLVRAASHLPLSELDRARVQWLREIFSDGVPGDATRVLELCEVAGRAARAGELELALNLLLGAALRCWWADAGPGAPVAVVDAADSLDVAVDHPMLLAIVAVAEPVRCARRVARGLATVDVDGLDDPMAMHLLGMAAHAIGDSPLASELLTRAEDLLRTQGRLAVLAQVVGMHVNVLLELGEWDRADERTVECRRTSAETGQPGWSIGAVAVDARSHALRGNTARALELAAEAELLANRQRLNDYLCCAQAARGVALLADDRPVEAFDALRRLFLPGDRSHHQRESFIGVMFLAEAAVRSGRTAEVRPIIDELERTALVTPSPVLHVHLAFARAVLADDERAGALFEEALAAGLARWPWTRARVELAYGHWLAERGEVERAAGLLESAATELDKIGAVPWSAIASRTLAALHGRSHRDRSKLGT